MRFGTYPVVHVKQPVEPGVHRIAFVHQNPADTAVRPLQSRKHDVVGKTGLLAADEGLLGQQ